MKILLIIFSLISFDTNAQLLLKIYSDTSKVNLPGKYSGTPVYSAYYLDSAPIKSGYLFLDTSNIKDLKIVNSWQTKSFRDSDLGIVIFRKEKTPLSRLGDLKIKFAHSNFQPIKYVIENVPISDTSNVLIERSAVKNITIVRNSKSKYFSNYLDSPVVLINSHSKFKRKKKNGH